MCPRQQSVRTGSVYIPNELPVPKPVRTTPCFFAVACKSGEAYRGCNSNWLTQGIISAYSTISSNRAAG